MNEPVYILIRTSRRPQAFKRCLDSVKKQTYPHIITIVHTDDPRDTYVKGDIIIKGSKHPSSMGGAPYNLYCNDLLESIPDKTGWFCFLDDDDEYTEPDAIEKMVASAKRDHINVCRVIRWNKQVYPKHWGLKQSLQTECFFIHTDHKLKARWWANRGGDHYYTKQLIRVLPINWVDDLTMVQAQSGKGRGKPEKNIDDSFTASNIAILAEQPIKIGKRRDHIKQGEISWIKYNTALEYEKKGLAKITYHNKTNNKQQLRIKL